MNSGTTVSNVFLDWENEKKLTWWRRPRELFKIVSKEGLNPGQAEVGQTRAAVEKPNDALEYKISNGNVRPGKPILTICVRLVQ